MIYEINHIKTVFSHPLQDSCTFLQISSEISDGNHIIATMLNEI